MTLLLSSRLGTGAQNVHELNGRNMSQFFYVLDKTARLLFVDDDPILREFAQVNLASPSACIETAAHGAEALERLSAADYDLVLLDLEMPVLNGFDTLAAIRANPRTAGMPVIVQTGREDVEAIDKAFRLGATSFVIKPLHWRLLTYQIMYVLRASEAELRPASEARGCLEAAA